ncbi:MAG: bifunctional adenosylcobinamide kinase/adenosylcobinamide-phosphate guanylyltransferase [Lentisphaeria bacterium]|nr:bifunctional adenosylcobinamide kinase/adenosylcobinamide-phosphate guanylyltransferase [Lentisphaeria bacterium]
MKLYIGGAFQGQEELARAENPDGELFTDFHEQIRRAVLAGGQEARDFARAFCLAHPRAVVVADEVGSGVVPVDAGERAYREAVGRALCVIAREAEAVTRCVCGIGVRIK